MSPGLESLVQVSLAGVHRGIFAATRGADAGFLGQHAGIDLLADRQERTGRLEAD